MRTPGTTSPTLVNKAVTSYFEVIEIDVRAEVSPSLADELQGQAHCARAAVRVADQVPRCRQPIQPVSPRIERLLPEMMRLVAPASVHRLVSDLTARFLRLHVPFENTRMGRR